MLLQTRGRAPRTRWLDRPREDKGRLRDSVQPPLLRLQAATPADPDRCRPERRNGPHPNHDRRADEMSFPRYPSYKASGVEWLGAVPEHWATTSLGRVTLAKCDGPFGSGLKSEHY